MKIVVAPIDVGSDDHGDRVGLDQQHG
jgi:hypothetical protein